MKRFKLIALLVAAIMVCQSFAAVTAFAADDSDLTPAEISAQAIEFLGTVGAITIDDEWDAAGLIGSVTRTYAATVFADIIRGRQTTHYPVVEPILEDVPAGKGNADNIFLAVAYDVIPEKEGKFDEKGLFTFGDLKYAVSSLLGYNNYAKATGLGEAEITRLIAEYGIFDGVTYKASQPLTKTEFAIILKNALHAEMIYQLSYSPDSFEFDRNTGVSMMEEYLGVAEYEGVITANPYTSVSNTTGCQDGEVLLGDMRCKTNFTNAADFIGCKVSAYVKEYDDSSKINEILLVDYASGVKVLTIDAEMINPSASGFRLTSIAYEDENGRNKKASVSATADYFYNGVACDLTVDDFRINSGAVTLISNNGNATYNVVKIDTYENYVVDYVDNDDILHCKLNPNNVLDLNEDRVEYINIRRTNNRVVKVSQLKEGNILSVYKSKDGSYIKATLSNTVVEGEIVGIDESGMRTVFSVDNGTDTVENITAFFMGTNWGSAAFPYPQKNFEGTFYLDANGYLAYAEVGAVLVQYGYITGVSRQTGLDDTVTVQLVDQSGNTRELQVPEKGVRTNDYINRAEANGKYTAATVYEILTETNEPNDMYKLVRFNANSKNMFTKLDFAADMYSNTKSGDPEDYYNEDIFTFNSYKASSKYKNHTKMFSGDHLGDTYGLNNDTIMFIVDRSNGDVKPENISIKAGSAFTTDAQYSDIYLYDADIALGVNAAVVSPPVDTSKLSALSNICVYDSMYSAIDEATEENKTYVKYWYGGKLTQRALADSYTIPEMNKGDAIFVTPDQKGEIITITNIKDGVWDNVSITGINGDKSGSSGELITNSYNYAVAGYVIGKSTTRLAVDFDAGDGYEIKSCILNNPVVYVVENIGNKTVITVSSMSAVNASLDNADDNKVILGSNHGKIGSIVVYK